MNTNYTRDKEFLSENNPETMNEEKLRNRYVHFPMRLVIAGTNKTLPIKHAINDMDIIAGNKMCDYSFVEDGIIIDIPKQN